MSELGQFYIGQTPAWPLQITVLDPDGAARDLSDVDVTVTLLDPLGVDVPGGITLVTDAEAGLVQYTWPSDPFAIAGEYLARTTITDDGSTDFASDVSINVHPRELVYTNLRVTPAEVERFTRVAVGNPEIDTAQFNVGIAVGFDLADDEEWDDLSTADQRWLQLAVSHQAASIDQGALNPAEVRPAGATQVRAGDVSITYSQPGSAEESLLTPLARMAISNLSWQGYRTLHPSPFLGSFQRAGVWQPL